MTYYKLTTGRIVSDVDFRKSFEIVTGLDAISNEEMYSRWRNQTARLSIEETVRPCKKLIDYCLDSGQLILAIDIYHNIYRCTLTEARNAVYDLYDLRERRMNK